MCGCIVHVYNNSETFDKGEKITKWITMNIQVLASQILLVSNIALASSLSIDWDT